jgi:hypothetical protein
MNVHEKRAYEYGVQQALTDELTKESGLGTVLGGIPKAVRGGLWGAGIGGAYGGLTGEGEDDILRGALTGGLLGTGVGYGSRHLTSRMKDITRSAPKQMWAARATPEAREMAMGNIGKSYDRLMQNPAERTALGKSLKSMGVLGAAGGIAGGPVFDRAQRRSSSPSYDQLYQYYTQNMSRR